MNIYKLTQDVNNEYDTYDSVVVAAENEEAARRITPDPDHNSAHPWSNTWCDVEHVQVEYIGEARDGLEAGVILASFNAG